MRLRTGLSNTLVHASNGASGPDYGGAMLYMLMISYCPYIYIEMICNSDDCAE